METQINTLIETIKADYLKFSSRGKEKCDLPDHRVRMIENFNNGIEVKEGRSYIKIMTNNSVWGFVVKSDDDKKFLKGDILKAASFASPARNAARGNVFADQYSVQWTGPHYLTPQFEVIG
ncbi:hypothetical protein N9R43_00460 [bacterium]|nr:hypothetical protein [bacterium]